MFRYDFKIIPKEQVRSSSMQSIVKVNFDRGREENSLHYRSRQPTSLYTYIGHVNDDVFALCALCKLRLYTPDRSWDFCFPSPSEPRIETIIIDSSPYKENIARDSLYMSKHGSGTTSGPNPISHLSSPIVMIMSALSREHGRRLGVGAGKRN